MSLRPRLVRAAAIVREHPTPLVPARILNEHVCCPRLAYLEWVDQRFEDNADTAHGTFVHRSVHDQRGTQPGSGRPATPSTAIDLSWEEPGLMAKVDVQAISRCDEPTTPES